MNGKLNKTITRSFKHRCYRTMESFSSSKNQNTRKRNNEIKTKEKKKGVQQTNPCMRKWQSKTSIYPQDDWGAALG